MKIVAAIIFCFCYVAGFEIIKVDSSNSRIEYELKDGTLEFSIFSEMEIKPEIICEGWSIKPDSIYTIIAQPGEFPGFNGCMEPGYGSEALTIGYKEHDLWINRRQREYLIKALGEYDGSGDNSIAVFEKFLKQTKKNNRYSAKIFLDTYLVDFGSDGVLSVIFKDGNHRVNITYSLECQFEKENPNEPETCLPDSSVNWYKGDVSSDFELLIKDGLIQSVKHLKNQAKKD